MKKFKIILFAFIAVFTIMNLTAQEKKFKKTMKVNGRIQTDYEFLQRQSSDSMDINGFEFRRLQLSFAGKISPKIKYKVEASFAHGNIGFRDVYIKYLAGKFGNFYIGSVPEPTGLEVMTSSKYITFFERAMLSSMQNFKWGAGLHYENFGLLDGKIGLQLALTNNGANDKGFKDTQLETGNNFIGRITGVLLNDHNLNRVVHLGLNFAARPNKDLKFRSENHIGNKYHYVFSKATGRQELGLEFGTTFNSISIQSEYKIQTFLNDINKYYKMSSFYVFGSYFITGEHRPYKHGAFSRVKPKKDIDNDGFGALELVARYSQMNASKDVVDANANVVDQINNISVGVNWYLTSHARIMYNYILTDDNNKALGNLSGHLIRVQVDF